MRRVLLPLLLCLPFLHAPSASATGGIFPPVLTITLSGPDEVTLNWPPDDTNYWLQATPLLGNPFFWTNVNDTPATSLTLAADQPAQFFRLIQSSGAPPPTELYLQSGSDGSGDYFFALNWDFVPAAASYNLYLAAAPGVTSLNYAGLPGGMAFKGITNIFASVPDVPDGVFTPALTAGTTYYFVVTAVSSDGEESANSNPASGIFGPSGIVDGNVFAQLNMGGNAVDVDLPNVSLSLVNVGNPAISNNVSSDMSGDFQFPALPAGNYQLCWKANGFVSSCSNIVIGNTSVDLGGIQLFPNGIQGLVYGEVTYQDGSPVYDEDSAEGINVDPTVFLTSSGNAVKSSIVNSSGQYVITGFSPAASMTVEVTVENSTVSSNINTFNTGEADLVLPETPPTIQSLLAFTNGVQVDTVPPGTTVNVVAGATGNNLTYTWLDASGPTGYPSSSNISWTLPANATGFQYLWLQVSDGFGGYATARLELSVNPYVAFSGTVVGSDTGQPIANALVNLNGQSMNADTNGDFFFELETTNQYNLAISAPGYAPLNNAFAQPMADDTYTLMAISPPVTNCPPYGSDLIVTNCTNGVIVVIPTDGLVDSNDLPYFGCVAVSLDTIDPCNPTNNFIGANLITNGGYLDPYGLVNIGVTDTNGRPLYLAAGFSAEVFLPITESCDDTNFPQPAGAYSFQIDPTGLWAPVDYASLETNLVCNLPINGYGSYASSFGLFCCGRFRCCPAPPPPFPILPPPQAIPPPVYVTYNLKFLVDDTLHAPLKVTYLRDNGQGKPDTNNPIYLNVDKSGDVYKCQDLPGATLWINVLSLRQAPGVYYGTGGPIPYNYQKDVIQVLKYTVPATSGSTVVMTLGLGQSIDQQRLAPLKEVPNTADEVGNGIQAGTLGNGFLNWRMNTVNAKYDAVINYYSRVDMPKMKTTFRAWQLANGWAANQLGPYGGIGKGDDAYAVYFNANDLGAGRRMGMKVANDLDGKPSVAYYVATYASLADAEYDEKTNMQPGDPNSKLKYIVCMDFSLVRNEKNLAGTPQRFIKFYAYTNAANSQLGIAGLVPNESRAQSLPVPYLCLKCHGAGTPNLMADDTDKYGDISGQFTPFDIASYTFMSSDPKAKFSPTALLPTFTKLNQGLMTGQNIVATMPANLSLLINYIAANNYTTSPPPKQGGWDWSADPNNLYNKVYAVSCRSCHVTFARANWSTPAGFTTGLGRIVGSGGNPLEGGALMPHAQRNFGIYWGSATAVQLNSANIIAQPKVVSQPATGNDVNNSTYFQ